MIEIKCAYTKLEPIENIKLNPRNTNKHSKEQIDIIAHSLESNGWRHPLIISNLSGTVTAGEGRYLAAKKLKISEVPVDYQEFESELAEYRFLEADNNSTKASEWDKDKFEENITDFGLGEDGFAAEDFGLLDYELKKPVELTPEEQIEKDEAVPELEDECVIAPGMLIELGKHKLLCGDCSIKENVELLMGEERADMVFTDPPYGVSYEKKCESIINQAKDRKSNKITGDDLPIGELQEIIKGAFNNIDSILADKSCYYICSPQGGELGLMMMMQESNLKCRHIIIWVKNAPVFSMGRLDYDYKHEPILYGWSETRTHFKSKQEGIWRTSVWECSREPNKLHPTMKPIALIENAINNSTDKGMIIYDPFGGSGSTIIACEKTGRVGRSVEIDPHYCQVIIERWQEYTGHKAYIINEGKRIPYEEL